MAIPAATSTTATTTSIEAVARARPPAGWNVAVARSAMAAISASGSSGVSP